MRGKRLIQVEPGVWVDPDHVIAVYPYAIGQRGFAKIVLDTDETIQCQEHPAIVTGKADPQVVEDLMQRIIDDVVTFPKDMVRLDDSYRP